jgi:HK97 family phage portal protein
MSLWSRSSQPITAGQVAREFQGVDGFGQTGGVVVPARSSGRHGAVSVTETKAMTHSAYWACLRVRADLLSTFPIDVLRDFDGVAVEMPKPPIMVDPGGTEWSYIDWMWASQRDLDSVGNTIGLIRERNGASNRYYPEGLPSRIELQDPRGCSVIKYKGKTMYRIDGKVYDPSLVYHERQYRMSGSPVGLAPVHLAAATIGEGLSMQQYGLEWFGNGGVPKAWMRNTKKRLQDTERDSAKAWYDDTISNGDLMVTGADWEYNMIQAETAGLEWLEGRRFSVAEICRFLSVPPEMIHGAVSGQSVTYANVSQANLQFLIMHMAPAVIRRENALSRLLPMPRYVKLNTDALLRMDPKTRQEMLRSQLEAWQITLSEARGLDNRPPLTAADKDEMTEIYGRPKIAGTSPSPTGDPATGGDQPAEDPSNPETIEATWTEAEIREASDFARDVERMAELTAA